MFPKEGSISHWFRRLKNRKSHASAERATSRRMDGVSLRSSKIAHYVSETQRKHPVRIPALIIVVLLTLGLSLSLFFNPKTPVAPLQPREAKANTYQFVPTSGTLVTGTEQNANSLAIAATEGVNTGSWKGTLADDNFHWMVTASDAGTPNLNMQLDLGTARLANANKLIIQTEVDLDSTSRLLKIQICDWVSSTSVDAAADSDCTTGGWRTINSKTAANADVDIAITSAAAFQWHLFDGYFSTGSTGGTAISTPLTNFTSSDTQPLRIRYWSDSDVSGNGAVAVDFLRATAFVDSVYHAADATNLNGSGGTLSGTYANTHIIGNTATAQQSLTASNDLRLTGTGTAGSIADFYITFKNVITYSGANTFYFKSEYSCSTAGGITHKFAIYNFATTAWEDLNSAGINCATADAVNAWAKNNVTVADYIDEAGGDAVRIRFYGSGNATTALRIDAAYLMLGSTNADTAQCEITWGSGTATNCTHTRDLDTPGTPNLFSNTAEDRSATADNDYYPGDCVANATTTEECAAANMNVPVTVPSNAQVVVNHWAGRYRGQLNSTNPDLLVRMDIRDYSGVPTTTTANGGWSASAPASTAGTFILTDSITSLVIGTYGNQTNPDDHVDTANNIMNLRLRTGTNGADSVNNIAEWDFGMASIGWVVDSSHPTRNYQFAPTGDTLVTGSETTRNAEVAAATSGVNTGGWQGTLGDDNMHWSVTGANVVGTNHDMQLNFGTAKLNGANHVLIQSEIDTDAALAVKWQICDWVSTTSVDNAADAQCTGGGWRSINSQTAANADVDMTANATVTLTWDIYDGYFTTGTTGGTAISTPLTNFFHSSNGVKIRIYNTVQTATAIDVDFIRLMPIIDTIYHPAGATNLNVSGGALANTYVNATAIGNQSNTSISLTSGDNLYLTGAGTAGSVADYYVSFKGIKPFTGANSIYMKAEYSCSAATAGLDHKFAIYNFTSAAWEDLNSTAIACSATDAMAAWAKNNITLSDYVNGGESRIRYYGDLNSTTTLRLDTIFIMIGATNSDTADCQVTFGSGTATDCSNTRNLDGPATPTTFNNTAEDESSTMGTGDANAYYAFDNETTPDITAEESTSANISFAVTQPTNSAIVGQHFAARFSGCSVCTTQANTVQLGFKDYSGFNQATGGWLQIGATSNSATQVITDSISASGITAYGHQLNPEDYLDTANNKINMRLRSTTPGITSNNGVTAWDFAMVSIQWIEIGNTIDIAGSSSVSGATVAVAVDGILQVGKTASTSGTCPCAWSITGVFVAGGRPIVVWHDGAADADESTASTIYDGTGNIDTLQLTAHYYSLGSGDDQTTSYAHLVLYDNDADEDVIFSAMSNTLTVDATSSFSDERINITSGDTLSMGGSETLTTYDIDIDGTLTSGGATTYNVAGLYNLNATGVFNEGTSTVNLIGTTSTNLQSACGNTDTCTDENFYNLTINKTDAADANDNVTITSNGIRVTNLLTITDGELIQGTLNIRAEGAAAISVAAAGKWTNTSTGDIKLGGTVVNAGYIELNSGNLSPCAAGADSIVITSTSGGSQRNWSGAGTFALYNLSVTDMTDSAITAYQSTYSNTTWTNGSCTFSITVSGNAYADHATTAWVPCDGSTANLSLVVDGTNSATTTTCADSDGAFSFVGVSVNPLAPISIFFNTAGGNTDKALSVTMLPISPTNVTLNIRKDIVWVTHESGVSSISNADIAHCSSNSPAACADAPFSRSGNNITVLAGYEVHVPTSKTYDMGAANLTTPKLHVQGTFIGGSFLSITGTGTGTNRPLYIDGGSFTAATQMQYAGDGDVEVETTTYDTLSFVPTITAARDYTSTGALTVNGNFTLNPTASLSNYLTFTLGGNLVMPSTATLQVRGTSAGGSILDTSGSNYSITTGLMSITNNGIGGELIANGSTITVTGTSGTLWTNSGTFTAGTSTVVFNSDASVTLTSNNNITFNNVSLTPALTSGQTYTFGVNPLTIDGNFLIQPSGSGLLTVNLGDHITVASTKTTTISGTGSGTSTVDLRPVSTDYNLTTGFLNIGAAGTLDGDSAASDITLTGTTGTLFTRAGTFTQGTTDVIVTSASGTPTLLSGATTFHKLTINAAATVINMGSVVTINNVAGADLTITSGVFNIDTGDLVGPGSGNGTLVISSGGVLCLGGTTNATNATCNSGATQTAARVMPTFQTYNFSAASTVYYLANVAQTISSTPTYGNLQFTPTLTTNRTYTLGGAMTINGDFTMNPGTANTLSVNAAGHITVATGKTTTITRTTSALTVLDLRPVSTDYNLTTGYLTIQNGGTLDAGSSASVITLTSTSGTLFTRNGTFTVGSSEVVVTSASGTPTLMAGTVTFHKLTINAAATVINMGTAVVTINNVAGAALTITSGVFNIDGAALTGPGTTNGTLTIGATGTLCLGGTTAATNATCDSGATQTTARTLPTFSDYVFNATSTVRYLNDAATTVTAPEALGNLQLAPALTADRTYTLGGGASEAFSVVYDGSKYVASGYDNSAGTEDAYVWESTDLKNWTPHLVQGAGGNQRGNDIIFANSKYIVAGSDSSSGTTKATVWESTDLTSWTARNVYATVSTLNGIIWDSNNSKYVVVGNESNDGSAAATAWESTNLTSWTVRTVGGVPVSNAYDIIWDNTNSKYVMAGATTSLGTDGMVWESADLTAWTPRSVIAGAGTDELKSVIYESTSGKYVVGGYESGINAQDAKIWESTNLTAWTSRTVEAATGDQQVSSVAYDSTNSKFIVGGWAVATGTYAGRVWESTNLTSWTTNTVSSGEAWVYSAMYDSSNSRYVAVGTDRSGVVAPGVTAAWTSTNLSSWSASTPSVAVETQGDFTMLPSGSTSTRVMSVNPEASVKVANTKTMTLSGSGTARTNYKLSPFFVRTNLDVGSLNITSAGASSVLDGGTSNPSAINIFGDYTNNGTFTASNTTVTLKGTSKQTLTGNMTSGDAFYNLTITNNSGASASDCERTGFTASVDFEASDATVTNDYTIVTPSVRVEYDTGNTYTFTNINWNGQLLASRIYFRNSVASGTWLLKVTGTQTVSYVNVSRSDASVSGGSTIIANDGTNIDCNNTTNWSFIADPAFNQVNYRFGSGTANNISYSGAPAENTPLTVTSTGQDFRLRMAMNVSLAQLDLGDETFKLQVGEKPDGGCSAATYADVTDSSGVIRYVDIVGLPNTSTISTVAGDPDYAGTDWPQTYKESNNFQNSVSAIPINENGVWDFSLENHSSVGSKRYCFKIVLSTGGDLDTYTHYPEVIIDEHMTFSLDASSVDYGDFSPGGLGHTAQSVLTTTTNAAGGYQVRMWATQLLTNQKGATIANWTGTNASPTDVTPAVNNSYFAYTTNDSNLAGGTADRFTSGAGSWAGFALAGPGDLVADNTSTPVTNDQFTVTYAIFTSPSQQSGLYNTTIIYINTGSY